MRVLVFVLAGVAATAANAQDLNSMMRASELGNVIASEELCGLTLDQTGIEAWIAANVAKDDLSFAGNLQTMTMGQEFQQRDMSASAKIAHCAAIKQAAGAMGLIK
jgi:hypothetical protein